MSHEFPGYPLKPTEEKKEQKPRMAGTRASRAILLASSLLLAEQNAEAKKSERHAHRDQITQASGSRDSDSAIFAQRISLNTKKDHGLEKEVMVSEYLGLRPFETEDDLREAIKNGELVDIHPAKDDGYVIDIGLGELASHESRPLYAALLPHASQWLKSISKEFYQTFHRKLVVNSAVRTKGYVDDLRKVNPLVAPEYRSTHLRGVSLDLAIHLPKDAKHSEEYRLTSDEQRWMSERLLSFESSVKIQATIENAHYHVMVYPQMSEEQKRTVADIDESVKQPHTKKEVEGLVRENSVDTQSVKQDMSVISMKASSSESFVKAEKYPSLSGAKDHGMEKEIDAAEHFGFKNFKSIEDIDRALKEGKLVELNPGDEDTYMLDAGIGELVQEENRHFFHCVLPYVKEQLEKTSYEFYSKFKVKLLISSAVRTEKYQDRLRKGNSNAAQGYTSSHLKGSTIDIQYFAPQNDRRPVEYRLSPAQQEWLDARLLMMELEGRAQVTKEKQQPVYHVMFYPEPYKK